MIYLIYKITNNINGKVYIGSHKTKNINDGYMGSGKYLNRAFDKNGIENFTKEILFVFDNATDMYAKEAEIVNEDFITNENTYNLKKGGFGGFDYINATGKNLYGKNGQPGYGGENLRKSKTKDRLIEQGRYNEYLDKISTSMKEGYKSGKLTPTFLGKKHTQDTINKLKGHSRSTGEKNSQFGTCWVTHTVLGNKKIKKDLIDEYIKLGYTQGRVIK